MAYQQRGGYGNQRGGNRGGNYGNRGGFRGGSRGGNRGGNAPSNYLRSSTFVKNVILEGENGKREPAPLEPGVTEEIAITLTAAKVEELKQRIEDAENDPNGDGGIRITMYCQNKVNQETGEEFDGASMMIVGKFPPRNQGGNRGGSFKGRGGNQGRRNYQQDDGGDEGNDQETANEDTEQSSRTSRGSRTQGSKKGGRTQNAQKNASHSDESDESYAGRTGKDTDSSYSEEPGW